MNLVTANPPNHKRRLDIEQNGILIDEVRRGGCVGARTRKTAARGPLFSLSEFVAVRLISSQVKPARCSNDFFKR
jgi:hypothetical protein